jgi:lipopolysaccharide export system permease protein
VIGVRADRAPRGLAYVRLLASAFVRPTILDRYMIAELVGPFAFGLSAFTLIFAATNILAISRLVSEESAPLVAAVEYFLWQMPQIVVTVVPMAMLLGTLLALGRLSGESEITALKAGGVGLVRAVAPLLVVGFGMSLLAFVLQEGVVPFANDRAVFLREETIKHVGAFGGGSHTVISQLPGGGQQVTYFKGYAATTRELLFVTIVTYGTDNRPKAILYSERGRYAASSWTFDNALIYKFGADGSIEETSANPHAVIDVGEKPSEIQQRATDNDRESMSRSQIRRIIDSGQLSPQELRAYETTYEGKLARPFASFVFTLIAIPFALRNPRGGGAGLGFGLALPIAFAYFVMASVFAALFTGLPGGYLVSTIGAWAPNVVFTAIGYLMLRRAARY